MLGVSVHLYIHSTWCPRLAAAFQVHPRWHPPVTDPETDVPALYRRVLTYRGRQMASGPVSQGFTLSCLDRS
jgi:hypothetical protein